MASKLCCLAVTILLLVVLECAFAGNHHKNGSSSPKAGGKGKKPSSRSPSPTKGKDNKAGAGPKQHEVEAAVEKAIEALKEKAAADIKKNVHLKLENFTAFEKHLDAELKKEKHKVEAKHVDTNRLHNLYAEFALYETIHEAFVDTTHKELFDMDTALNAERTKKHQKEEQFGARRLIKELTLKKLAKGGVPHFKEKTLSNILQKLEHKKHVQENLTSEIKKLDADYKKYKHEHHGGPAPADKHDKHKKGQSPPGTPKSKSPSPPGTPKSKSATPPGTPKAGSQPGTPKAHEHNHKKEDHKKGSAPPSPTAAGGHKEYSASPPASPVSHAPVHEQKMVVESPKNSAEGNENGSGSGLSPMSSHRVHEIPQSAFASSSDDDEAADQASRSYLVNMPPSPRDDTTTDPADPDEVNSMMGSQMSGDEGFGHSEYSDDEARSAGSMGEKSDVGGGMDSDDDNFESRLPPVLDFKREDGLESEKLESDGEETPRDFGDSNDSVRDAPADSDKDEMEEASMDSDKEQVREREGSDAAPPVEAKRGGDSDENDAAKDGDEVEKEQPSPLFGDDMKSDVAPKREDGPDGDHDDEDLKNGLESNAVKGKDEDEKKPEDDKL